MLTRILEVMRRGVEVRILCGGKHGLHQPDLMYSFALWRLIHQAGAKVHKQKNLRSHAKLVIVDGRRAILGSQNFDQPAFDLRREVSAIVHSDSILERLVNIFAFDWAASQKYEPPDPMDHNREEEEGELARHAAISHA
jgi:cardiolipin synthase A/B